MALKFIYTIFASTGGGNIIEMYYVVMIRIRLKGLEDG